MEANPHVAPALVDGFLGGLCVLDGMGEESVEPSSEAKRKRPEIMMVLLDSNSDSQLSGIETIPALCRPEFFHGKLNSSTSLQVKKAVDTSRECRDMCAQWAEHSILAGRNSQINEKILRWCQDEFFRAGPQRPYSETLNCDIGNGDRVAPQTDKADGESSIISSVGKMLRKVLCCCYRPAVSTKGNEPDRKEVQIFIKRLNGSIFAVNINAGKQPVFGKESHGPDLILMDKVSVLKKKIYQEKGIPPSLQFLVLQNKNLDDDKSLHECGVFPRSIIHLIQLRSVLGVGETVDVTVKEHGIEFNQEQFSGLYRWYQEGQHCPDVYMGQFFNGRFQGVGEIIYQHGGFYRGDWADDQQHGFGVQRWKSGAFYCGEWNRNKEDGWGAYFLPCNAPSQHNPNSTQMIFLGRFHNGCPMDGMVIECKDFRELKVESFRIQQSEAAAADIYSQAFRVYDVTYDGATAFWQQPIPREKRGLFDIKIKLCEYETSRVDNLKPLFHKRSLEEIWYKWIPKQKIINTNNSTKTARNNEDKDKTAGPNNPVSAKDAQRDMKFETFYYLGTCVRDKKGQFPCPTDGTLSIFAKMISSRNNLKIESPVEYKAKFNPCSISNPTLHRIEGKVKYAVPDDGSFAKDSHVIKSSLKVGKDVNALLTEFLSIVLLGSTDYERIAGLITHIEFEGEMHPLNFPIKGIMLVNGEIMTVKSQNNQLSGKSDGIKKNAQTFSGMKDAGGSNSGADQDVDDIFNTENGDDSSWSNMKRYCINFKDWMQKSLESKSIIELPRPVTEPSRKDQTPVLREPFDAMEEAVKMQTREVWSSNGMLARRCQDFPLETYIMETVNTGTGIEFQGWSRKVYCPKLGTLKLIIEDDPRSNMHAREDDNQSLRSQSFDIEIDLKECVLYPGTEDWFKYSLTKLKMGYIQRLKTEHDKLKMELIQLKSVDFKKAKTNLSIGLKELISTDDSLNYSYQHQIFSIFFTVPFVYTENRSNQPGSSRGTLDLKNKAVNAAKKKLFLVSYSIIEKELEAAKKYEVGTGVAIIENASRFSKAKDSMTRHRYLLWKELENFANVREACNANVEKLSKISKKLNANVKPLLPGQEETSAQVRAKKARLAVELARVDPSISEVRMSIVCRTIRLLEEINAFEKAAKVQLELLKSKAEARLLSNAALHRKKLLFKALSKNDFTALNLDSDDSVMLSDLKDPTKDDLLRRINAVAADLSRESELLQLQAELDMLEEKEKKEEVRIIDLNAEIQIARAHQGTEEAENDLWFEWAHSAIMEETDKPNQGPTTSIGLKQAALDEANKRLTKALCDAQREADMQFRKSEPASEVLPEAELRKKAWVPSSAVSAGNLAKAESKLTNQAHRSLRYAAQCLHGPESMLVSPPLKDTFSVCTALSHAEMELQQLQRKENVPSSHLKFSPKRTQNLPDLL